MMQVSIAAVGVLATGLPHWSVAREVIERKHARSATSLDVPQPNCLAPAERRRACPTVRLALAVAEQALGQCDLAAEELAMVFASYEAAGVITHQLCEALASTREISPTQFHNSVHNAPCGYYSIGMHAKLAGTSVCRGEWSFTAGLLNAMALVATDHVPVLFVCYDSPLPSPMVEVMPVSEPTAIALVLTPEPSTTSLVTLRGAVQPRSDASHWPEWIPAAWYANATARGFAALELVAQNQQRRVALPLSPELDFELTRC